MQDATDVWTAIHTFPAADGSRTLRVRVLPEVIDGLFELSVIGFRHTCSRSRDKRIMSKSEVCEFQDKWVNTKDWEKLQQRRLELKTKAAPKPLPTCVYQELQRGNIVSIHQTTTIDSKIPSMSPNSPGHLKHFVEIETADGETLRLDEWLRREACQVEMCFPLSKVEAEAFLDHTQIQGVRHSFVSDPYTGECKHTLEVNANGEQWEMLPPWAAGTGESIGEPHFRITYQNKLNFNRSRLVVHSKTPWVTAKATNSRSL
eukprot:Blabericola_migrator_1__5908@NODE_298_length_10203_cov_353_110695_g245_i0_p5_GENE_NODE_298_length_10203_cov_353_110695_g245_i0NODE_298_length_10203_cov_353_110695_g245_i0_p5_ORF_typecomplete_len260_score42_28EnoRase_FAD_bd/PF07055_12/0_23_NODE_298_length_10203_cov_353_110695_g245_i082208999